MPGNRRVDVHFLPELVHQDALRDATVVVIDILRATTTMVHALAAGCSEIYPTETISQARMLRDSFKPPVPLLAGERGGVRIEGFDLGNSPSEFTQDRCLDRPVICTTTNGTRAIVHACQARRILIGAFVNYSAICEELRRCEEPIHLLCAGAEGEVALEDVLFAGAVVDFLAQSGTADLSDAARIAWDAYEHHGDVLICALELSQAGQRLLSLGFDLDLKDAAAVDRFGLVPEVCRSPLRILPATLNLECNHYRGHSGLV